jgi:6-phosphogluconolactonase (cycloisomerase 2 family)
MKFTKFGKALLMSALSAGVVLSLTSCVQSYTTGFLYVTGTVTSGSGDSGIVSGFKIDHNTGKLTSINGLPVSSGGSNPVRAVLLGTSRYLYVLNRGVSTNPGGTGDCTTLYPCTGSNIEVFSIGGNGILTPQQTFYTEGFNPFRMIADSAGTHLYVLDHDSPDNYKQSNTDGCALALAGVQTCGDITAFTVNPTTGYLTLIQNAQVTASGGAQLPYFPVPANPVDFVPTTSYILTLNATSATASVDYPYTGGATVYPYNYVSTTGQLTTTGTGYPWDVLSDSSASGVPDGTAIASAGSYIYVLDNKPFYKDGAITSQSQILPYGPTIGTNGSLEAVSTGNIPDDANQSNPTVLTLESKGEWFYVANQGNNVTGTVVAGSGISGYVVNTPYLPTEMSGTPIGFGSGYGPQCLVEDPSNQFIYTANINDSSVTGQVIDQNKGTLTPLSQSSKVPSEYALSGPPTWCLVDGRTN